MNILLLRGFNNYFNRIVKKYSTLADYKSNSHSYLDLTNINFNPNDGVSTELIIGSANQKENNAPLAWDQVGTPDYLICYEMEGTPTAPVIKFRWFVLESERTRNGQYRIALKRDVVVDHLTQIMSAPCFVEKGSINDIANPLLYNNESMTYNQIKKDERFLKDSTGSAWIIGYMAKNRANTAVNVSTTVAIMDGVPIDYYDEDELPFTVSTSSATSVHAFRPDTMSLMIPMSFFRNGGWGRFYATQGWHTINYGTNLDQSLNITNAYVSGDAIGSYDPATQLNSWGCEKFSSQISGYASTYKVNNTSAVEQFQIAPVLDATYINLIGKKYFYSWDTPLDHDQAKQASLNVISNLAPSNAAKNAVQALVNDYMENDGYAVYYGDILSQYNNKFVKVGSDYYRMSIEPNNEDRFDIFYSNSSNYPTYTASGNNTVATHIKSDIIDPMIDILNSMDSSSTYFVKQTGIKAAALAVAQSKGYNIILSRLSTEQLDVTLQTGKRATYDCPANLFAIPYGNLQFKTSDNSDVFMTQPDEGLALARAIAQSLGDSVIYDLQLVPYVPSQIIRNLMSNSDTLVLSDLESATYDVATRTISGTTTNASFVLYPSSCKGTFDILETITPYAKENYSAALNHKISNETELCRLVSPNFNGMFEFGLAKNNSVESFNVDYTYKPIQPYIHINPNFKFIYGQDWDDARGLICGGDFSLSFINDAWINYENNNKNYQQIFNRQIENMDINNQIAKEQLDWKTFAGYFGGGIGGGVGGAVAGAKVGGPYGAIAGAIGGAYMGTVGAYIGGEMDKEWLARQQAETKDYTIDMYGYNLGNIKAMPYSLSRSESLTNNNKIWPIVELYGPTEKEIDNLINKIKYNGMTIMAIGTLNDYTASNDFSLVMYKVN